MPRISDQGVVAEAIAAPAEIDENIQPEPTVNTHTAVVADTVEAEAVMSQPPTGDDGLHRNPDSLVMPAMGTEPVSTDAPDDEVPVSGGTIQDSAIPQADAIAETELYTRFNDLCEPPSNSTDPVESTLALANHSDIKAIVARGKFSPPQKPFKEMTASEVHAYTKELNVLVCQEGKFYARNRRSLGQALFVMRERIAQAGGRLVIVEGQPAMNWGDYCTSIGIDRRCAYNLAEYWRAPWDAPVNLFDAAASAGIDLYRPKTAMLLRAVNKELNGRKPSESELPALLERLDPPDEPKPATAKSTRRKSGNKRRKPKPPLTRPQPMPANTMSELLDIWSDFFNRHPELTIKDFLYSYAMAYPKHERFNILIAISDVAIAVAELAASEEPDQPPASMSSPVPTVDGLSPLPEATTKLPPTPERSPVYRVEDVNPELKGTFIKFGSPQPFEISGHPFDLSGHPIEFDDDTSESDDEDISESDDEDTSESDDEDTSESDDEDTSESDEDTLVGARKSVASEVAPDEASESEIAYKK